LAIVHGQGDPMVDFDMGRYAATLFNDAGWAAVHFFTSDNAGHMFARLPVGDAIHWLESLASNDPDALLSFVEKQSKPGSYRDAVAALGRAKTLKLTDQQKQRADRLGGAIDAKAKAGADEFLPKIRQNVDGSWIDGFLAYRDDFALADGAREAMDAFESLCKQHESQAQRAFGEARAAFQQGKPDQAYAKYQDLREVPGDRGQGLCLFALPQRQAVAEIAEVGDRLDSYA
jgi:hypothetical protein